MHRNLQDGTSYALATGFESSKDFRPRSDCTTIDASYLDTNACDIQDGSNTLSVKGVNDKKTMEIQQLATDFDAAIKKLGQ